MSLKITHKYKVDFTQPRVESCIEVMQGDNLTRCVKLMLFCDGAAWNVPESAAVTVHWCRPDGQSGSYQVTAVDNELPIDGNYINAVLPAEVTAVPGVAHVCVNLVSGMQELNTWAAKIKVKPNPHYQA